LRWNFEGLLRKSFPGRAVSVKAVPGAFFDFSCAGLCGPLSVYSSYAYVFGAPGGSGFHVASRKFHAGTFGNYPLLVLVRGQSVACNQKETRFLIEYGNSVAFTLGCLPPPG
jgi:hypothetical protein